MTNTHLGARVRGERGVKPPTGWMIRQAIPGCATCTEVGRKGCCAPLRCYCGHDTCHAFASWKPRPVLNVTDISKPKGKKGSAWAEREESTWIDKL